MTDGIVVVDKPSDWTSHDVVARIRRLARTRKVGHAGTLDPMATGVLVLGLGRATRLLGHLSGDDKEYLATLRLGSATTTDDAEGELLSQTSAAHIDAADLERVMAGYRGPIEQVPSTVSAIKIDGRRAYARAREGEDVQIPARPVTVYALALDGLREGPHDTVDADVRVVCSSGTYVRALARDIGRDLGVGGHLTALRRVRSGGFTLQSSVTLETLEESFAAIPMAEAVRVSFTTVVVDADDEAKIRHGRSVEAPAPVEGPFGVMTQAGEFLALYQAAGPHIKPVAVFV